MPRVNLGDRVRDRVSGFEGIALGRCEWLYGCVTVNVKPMALHDGKPIDTVCFDEDALAVVEAGAVGRTERAHAAPTGGPDRPAMAPSR